jgi:hypothetical protein
MKYNLLEKTNLWISPIKTQIHSQGILGKKPAA